MYKLHILLTITFTAFTVTAAVPKTRIIGGDVVNIAKHPYLVSMRHKAHAESPYLHKCAGSIYSDRIVITAAQCVVNFGEQDRIIVVAGANTRTGGDGQLYPVKNWISHPGFSVRMVDYDIGILILDEPFSLTPNGIRSIGIRETRPDNGKKGTVVGWGYREEFGPSSYYLLDVQVPIVSTEDCIESYGVGEVTERMICAGYLQSGGKDACQGDTGGPLVIEGELVGLVSWGRGCARPGYPGVYTFVGSLTKWIDDTIKANT